MNFEKESGVCDCVPVMPKETIKDITGTNYQMLCEINAVLSAIEAETFGIKKTEHNTTGEDTLKDTLEAALIGTNKILDNIVCRLHQFADLMGVQI